MVECIYGFLNFLLGFVLERLFHAVDGRPSLGLPVLSGFQEALHNLLIVNEVRNQSLSQIVFAFNLSIFVDEHKFSINNISMAEFETNKSKVSFDNCD